MAGPDTLFSSTQTRAETHSGLGCSAFLLLLFTPLAAFALWAAFNADDATGVALGVIFSVGFVTAVALGAAALAQAIGARLRGEAPIVWGTSEGLHFIAFRTLRRVECFVPWQMIDAVTLVQHRPQRKKTRFGAGFKVRNAGRKRHTIPTPPNVVEVRLRLPAGARVPARARWRNLPNGDAVALSPEHGSLRGLDLVQAIRDAWSAHRDRPSPRRPLSL